MPLRYMILHSRHTVQYYSTIRPWLRVSKLTLTVSSNNDIANTPPTGRPAFHEVLSVGFETVVHGRIVQLSVAYIYVVKYPFASYLHV